MEMIRELEMVDGDMINVLYNYNKLGNEQLEETMKSVAEEHHSRSTGLGLRNHNSKQANKLLRKKKRVNV